MSADYCATHKPKNLELGYIAYAEWAERQRHKQRMCPTCRRWLWRSEFGPGWAAAIRDPGRADTAYMLGENVDEF